MEPFLDRDFLTMNGTDEGGCDSDCLDHWAGFWIEGVVLPIIAALGIAGAEKYAEFAIVCETKTDLRTLRNTSRVRINGLSLILSSTQS